MRITNDISGNKNIPPLGITRDEWERFCDLFSHIQVESPELIVQKLMRKVITRMREIFPYTPLRARFAQTYIDELRLSGNLIGEKKPNQKVYQDSSGRRWKYMDRDQLIVFFSSKSKRETLIKYIRGSGGLFPGYAAFAKKQNKMLAQKGEPLYHCIPATYKTLVFVLTGSTTSLNAAQLGAIGMTEAKVDFILSPERSRKLADKNDIQKPVVREAFTHDLSYASWKGMEFRAAFTRAVRRWNRDSAPIHGFTLPVQINHTKSGASWQDDYGLPDASFRTILSLLGIPPEVWTDKEYYIRPFFQLLTNSGLFDGKSSHAFSRSLELDDFEVIDGVFRFTRKGRSKYDSLVSVESVQARIDEYMESKITKNEGE